MASFEGTPEFTELTKIDRGGFIKHMRGSSAILTYIPGKKSPYFDHFYKAVEFIFGHGYFRARRPSAMTFSIIAILLNKGKPLKIGLIKEKLGESFFIVNGSLEIVTEQGSNYARRRYSRSLFENLGRSSLFEITGKAVDVDERVVDLSRQFKIRFSRFFQRQRILSVLRSREQ